MTQLKVKLLNKDAKVPTYGSEQAGAFDFYATEDVILNPIGVNKDLHHMGGLDRGSETNIHHIIRDEWDGYFAGGYEKLKSETLGLWDVINDFSSEDFKDKFIFQTFFRFSDDDIPSEYLLLTLNKEDFSFRMPFVSDKTGLVEFFVTIDIPDLENLLSNLDSDIDLSRYLCEENKLIINAKDVLAYHIDDFYSIKYGVVNSKSVGTGIALQLEPDEVLNVRPRSGLWFKHGVTVFGGTIDADYRGEIKISMYNTSSEPFKVEKGMRIAQGIITKFEKKEMVVVDELDDTARGVGGFASTGLK